MAAGVGGRRRESIRGALGRDPGWCCVALALLGLSLFSVLPVFGQGIGLRGIGPVNESMAGAATGSPIDSTGALYWNPASISGLPASDMSFGLGLILPSSQLHSRIDAGALGPGIPPMTFAGASSSEPGIVPVPSMAMVRKVEGSPWTYGLGMFAIGGCRVNYPASPFPALTSNPILTPQPPLGLGLGRLSANFDLMQIVPTVSYDVNRHLSIGFAPTVTLAQVVVSPMFLAPFDDANGDGFSTYSRGLGTRYAWGGGFQVGAYYTTDVGWHFGLSFKSQQWMEDFRFRTEDELGAPRDSTFDLDYPMIISLGASYTGFENWVLACDVRYFDYANTPGFGKGGFAADGALTGLAWENLVSVALGVQRRLSERWFVRAGYCYNDNPILAGAAQFNVASPLVIQHTVHVGLSYCFDDNWICAVAYTHAFENDVSGPMVFPGLGPLPGTEVGSKASADSLSIGVSKRF